MSPPASPRLPDLCTAAVLALFAAPALAQDVSAASPEGQAILEMLRAAEELGEALKNRVELIERDFDLPDDLAERAIASLENGRVRELLGVEAADEDLASGENAARYEGGVFLFASFSMPDASLKSLLADASRMGVPVFFHGFVEGSVFATQARVEAIYGGLEEVHGFGIDPTLFERFEVDVVPTLVSTTAVLDVCKTADCGGETIPHDRMSGNVPLPYALRILAVGNGAHAAPAAALLKTHEIEGARE